MARLARVVAVRYFPPRYSTWRCATIHPCLRYRAHGVSGSLRQPIQLHGLPVLGYCLMSNHVHLVVVPHKTGSFGLGFKTDARALRVLLECCTAPAGTSGRGGLFLSAGSAAPLGSAPLCRTESGSSGINRESELWKWSRPAHTAGLKSRMYAWRWRIGVNHRKLQAGGIFLKREKLSPIWFALRLRN